jgi:hypothetical protein
LPRGIGKDSENFEKGFRRFKRNFQLPKAALPGFKAACSPFEKTPLPREMIFFFFNPSLHHAYPLSPFARPRRLLF